MGSVCRSSVLLSGLVVLSALAMAQVTTCASDTDGAHAAPVACVTGDGVQVRPVGESAPVPGAPPLTPEQKPATPPSVTYENGKLTIVAKNAVLKDILNAVAEKTGASIDMPEEADERVVSQLGPGPARDVIAALLNGSHYNYVMVGSEDSPNSVAHVIVTAKADKDAPKGPAPAQGPVVAGVRPQPQPRSALGQTIMQPYQAMLEQQQAQQVPTADFQAQSQATPALPAPEVPAQAQTASSEEPAASANPEGPAPSSSSPVAAAPSAVTGTVAPVAATGPTGTESASIVETPASVGDPSKNANAADRTPMQVLQDLYDARRKMIEAQRQPPPPPSQ